MQINIILPFAVGFLSCQRFLLPDVYAYVCIIPLLCAVFYINNNDKFVLWILIALFAKSDMGGENAFIVATPAFLRNLIILFGFLFCLRQPTLLEGRGKFLVLAAFPLAATMMNLDLVDIYWFQRDLFNLFVVTLSLIKRPFTTQATKIIYGLSFFSLGALCSEIVNILFVNDSTANGYLSLDSLKCGVTIFSIYSLQNHSARMYLPAIASTLFVLINYSSRMLLITYLFVLLLIAARKGIKWLLASIAALAFTFSVTFLVYISSEKAAQLIDSKKALFIFDQLFVLQSASGHSFFDYLYSLDSFRASELKLITDLGFFRNILGIGLGAPLVDEFGYTSHALDDGNTYSLSEIMSGHLYRLHDSWSYLGLKIGFFYYFYIVLMPFIKILRRPNDAAVIFLALCFLVLLNGSFTVAGILVYSIISILATGQLLFDNSKHQNHDSQEK